MSRVYWALVRLVARVLAPGVTYKKLFLHPVGEYISDQIRHRHCHYEIENLLKVKAFCNPSIFVDIGANLGNHSNFFYQLGSKVLAFEPASLNFGLLIKNIPAASSHRLALGNSTGTVDLVYSPNSMGNSYVEGSMALSMDKQAQSVERVNLVRIDDLQFVPLDSTLVKIDAEGSELEILKGGDEFFNATAAKLWLELHKSRTLKNQRIPYNRQAVIDWLIKAQYRYYFALDGTNHLFSKERVFFWKSIEHFPVAD